MFEKYGREGAYVVVTGGNSGIGMELCVQMARLGFNICIIGRNKEKIEASIPYLLKESGKNPDVKVVIADFSTMSKMSEYNTLAKELSSLDIAMLDLNAGVLEISEFSDMADENLESMLNCNALHPIYLTKALLNKMLTRDLRSSIIIMSSIAGCYEHPGMAAYCATKTITNFFAKSLSHEVKEKIDVISYAPGMVSTPMMPLEAGSMNGAVASV
jgi:short-subunit dehydrogenase